MRSARVFAPGTIANVGPGFDVLGLCLESFGDEVTVASSATGRDEIRVTGRDANQIPLDFSLNCAGIAAAAVRRSIGRDDPLLLTIHRSLPLSGGLGASAAASVGGALAAALAFEIDPTMQQLLEWALAGEEAVAGRHLDNIVPCLWGGLSLAFFAGQGSADTPVLRACSLPRQMHVALVTPSIKIETKAARAILPTHVSRQTYVQGLAHAVGVTAALMSGDVELLRSSMFDPFAVAVRKNLIPHFDDAERVAHAAGAIAFSISGSGPTLFALCADAESAQRVAAEIAHVYSTIGASSHVCRIAPALKAGLDDRFSLSSALPGGARCLDKE
jgi:homoserine kinase